MKAYLIIVPLSIFILISWVLFIFIFIFYILSEENYKLENSLDSANLKVDSLNDATNTLWEERVFEKEMKENLAYYLPEGFSSKINYNGLTPLDIELGRARVYFVHRYRNYSVDFSYFFDGEKLKVERLSAVNKI